MQESQPTIRDPKPCPTCGRGMPPLFAVHMPAVDDPDPGLDIARGMMASLPPGKVYRIPETGLHGAFRDVAEFMRAVDQPIPDLPVVPDLATKRLRFGLVLEELTELAHAYNADDLPAVCDAILDSVYVLLGMGLAYGMDLPAGWAAVQEANLRKAGGPKCPETGKALKPPGFVPPDIEGLLALQRPLSEVYPATP